MLTKRTNILLKEEDWKELSKLAQKKHTSAGQLIREAINTVYFASKKSEEMKNAYEDILKIRKVQKGKIDYKELINYGRK